MTSKFAIKDNINLHFRSMAKESKSTFFFNYMSQPINIGITSQIKSEIYFRFQPRCN